MEDAALWTQDPKVASTIENRLGWLRSARMMQTATGELKRFAKETCKAGFKHVVLLGMGGSSLCPEVCARTFGSRNRFPELIVLDNTSPDAVKAVEKQIDLKSTLFIPASKSGTTIETNSFYKYFKGRLASAGVKKPGARFIAITDPGSPLVELARKDKFRRLFENPADIGGRFSALSFFGLVPMALLGIDVEELLKRSVAFTQDGGDIVPVQANQPVRLGAALATWAKAGRDKVTFSLSPRLASFGDWVEQLVAESTGKQGVGILPVVGERTALPSAYGKDRVFVSIRLANEKDDESRLEALEKAGAPVVRIVLGSAVDLGAEFLRWEIATATMGALLGINPFDEPNVSESKQNSSAILNQFAEQRKLPVPAANLIDGGLAITFSGAAKRAIGSKISRARDALRVLAASATEGEYVALLAFLHATKRVETRLANIRAALRNSTHRATTLGYGPRYLHSTGQFHKGGPNSGIFFMFTADPAADMEIPGEPYSFAVLARAQALGDFRSLDSHGRRAVLIHLGSDVEAGLKRFAALLGVQA
jgi:glucose-6-phosphate isomerase